MTRFLRFLAPFVIVVAAACGGSADSTAESKTPAPARKKSAAELRADELIADLQKREAAQTRMQQQAAAELPRSTSARPVPAPSTPSASYQPASTSPPTSPATNDNDANYWRQEFTVASARLQTVTQQMEQARQRMEDAQRQSANQNTAVSRIGQDAYNRAQQEYSAAQSAVGSAQSAVNNARQNALNAGVPASYLR